jgi:hypothetical protein
VMFTLGPDGEVASIKTLQPGFEVKFVKKKIDK